MAVLLRSIVFSAICCAVDAQNITTIVGGGPRNAPALQIGFQTPNGVAVDSAGNIYVSPISSNQIWKIDTSGHVNVFAGTGGTAVNGVGDGGPAINANLAGPAAMALDSLGNLYLADSTRVRKISTAGTISTVAGGGTNTNDGILATTAQLRSAAAIALDSANNLYIADASDNRIRLVSSSTGIITTVAGNGGTGSILNYPTGVAVDSAGAVYIADSLNYRIRKVVSGVITTVAGTGVSGYSGDSGSATAAQISPTGVAVDQFNNLYILDGNHIREIQSGQTTISTFVGAAAAGFTDGSSSTARFSSIIALAFDSSNNAYVADSANNRIRKIAASVVTTVAGNGTAVYSSDGQLATNVNVVSNGFAVNSAGLLDYSDGAAIRTVTLSSGVLSTLAGNGIPGHSPDGPVSGGNFNPSAPVFDSAGTVFYIEGGQVRKIFGGVVTTVAGVFGATGFVGEGTPATSAYFNNPTALAVAANGDVFVVDSNNYRIRMISAQTGDIITIAGNGSSTSSGDGGLATNAGLALPRAIALDGNGNLFIAESYRIRKVNLATNIITTAGGNGSTTSVDGVAATSTGIVPNGIFADQSGNLFISEALNYHVRKVTASTGLISTVAGNGTPGTSGDGGPATSAGMQPLGIAVDRSQNLYIQDGSHRIRVTQVVACFFTLSAGSVLYSRNGGAGSLTITATDPSCPYSVSTQSPFVTITGGATGTGSGTITYSVSANTGAGRTATVALAGQSFSVSQLGSIAQFNIGFFQPSNPAWVLDANGNGYFDAGDKVFSFAGFSQPGAIAVVGDWNGDGRTKIGYYINGFWVLDYDGDGVFTSADKFYAFGGGGPSYVPVVGDWNGSGTTKIGFYRAGFWVLDINGDGVFNSGDGLYALGGNAGEIPIVGDWNGDHRTKIGFYFNGGWVLDYNGNGTFDVADKYYGGFSYLAGDKPVVGDWSGSGTTKIGVFRNGFWVLDYNGNGVYESGIDKFYAFSGNAGDAPIVADWNGDGRAKVGVFNSGFWTLDFNGNGTYDAGDRFLAYYGGAGSQPLIGRW